MKRIGFITESIRDDETGVGKYAENFINFFIKEYGKEITYEFIDYKITTFNKDHLYYLPLLLPKLKFYSWYYSLPFRIAKDRYDAVFCFTPVPHLFTIGKKEFFVIHDLFIEKLPQTHPVHRVFLQKLFFKQTIQNVSSIITVSEYTKNEIIAYYSISPSKIDTVNFIPSAKTPLQEKKPALKLAFPYILNINTIEPRKNIGNLIQAFARLKKNFDTIPHKLIIVGKKGWKYKQILKTIEDASLDKDIILTGYLNEQEKKYLLRHASLFIYPSFGEGFGIPVIEAMEYGLPIITSNTSYLKTLTGNAALHVDPYSVRDIADKIALLIANSALRHKLIQRGNRRYKYYSDPVRRKKQLELVNARLD